MLNLKHIIKVLPLSFACITLISVSSITFASKTAAKNSLITVSDTKRLKTYLKADANLGSYKSFTIDPVVATFKDGWQKKYNQSHRGLSQKIKEKDATEIKGRVEKQFQLSFPKYISKKAGLAEVNTPHRNTLRLKPVISDLIINAPDIQGPTSNIMMVRQVGSATLTLEVYDASSNVLLAKLISKKETRDNHELMRTNRVTNNSEFRQVYNNWARDLVKLIK